MNEDQILEDLEFGLQETSSDYRDYDNEESDILEED